MSHTDKRNKKISSKGNSRSHSSKSHKISLDDSEMSSMNSHAKPNLYAKSSKISRDEIINTFEQDIKHTKYDASSSDDIPNNTDYSNIDLLLKDDEGNRFDLNTNDIYNENEETDDSIDDSIEYAIDEKDVITRQYGGLIIDDYSVNGYDDIDEREDDYVDKLDYHIATSSGNKKDKLIHDPQLKKITKYNRAIGRAKFENDTIDLDENKIPIHREIIIKDTEIPDFLKEKPSYTLHEDVDYPKFGLGFTHWIHASKNKTDIFKTFDGKKRVYQVINGYERYIDDYDESIGTLSKRFFASDNRPNILSRAFYKLWEILYYFDLIDVNSKNFISAHLAEGPGSFIQATMFFREMFAVDTKNDKYHAITIHGENEDNSLELEKDFVQYYAKEKPQRLFMHKTYDTQSVNSSNIKDNGDITKIKTIDNFKKDIGTKVDFITGDGGFEWNNENIQEQECATLIFSQILTALIIQKKGGNFVLKMFETFTTVSLKLILLLKYFYTHVNIIKPFTSRESNSEKYVICRDFKYNEDKISSLIQKLMQILNEIDNVNSKREKNMFLSDIFKNVKIPDELFLNMISINTEISNRQFKVINKMIEYIEGSNFHGEVYMKYKNRQISLTNYWLSMFMTDDKNLETNKQRVKKLIDISEKIQTTEYDRFKNNLIGFDVSKDKPVPKTESIKKISRSKGNHNSNSKTKTKTRSKSRSKSRSDSKSKNKSEKPIKNKKRIIKRKTANK